MPITGKFKDPSNPVNRLYGEVLTTHKDLHFVKVTHRNAIPVESFTLVVPSAEFITDSGANKWYWRRQLRGKDGKWIEMGGGIEWQDINGKTRQGKVVGFDDEIRRVIVKDFDGTEYKLSADEIRQSAVKAILSPNAYDNDNKLTESEIDIFLGNDKVDLEDFKDNDKFPIGGPPLEIKDKQGNTIGRISKQANPDANDGYDILLTILAALLPHEMIHLLRGVRDK